MCPPSKVMKEESKTPSKKDHHDNDWTSSGAGIVPCRDVLFTLLIMTGTPSISIIFHHVVANMEGNFWKFAGQVWEEGFVKKMMEIWPPAWDPVAWKLIFGFFAFELMLMKVLPGKEFKATITPMGNQPIYKANGMLSYLVTLGTFLVLTYFDIIRPALVWDKFGCIISSINVFAVLFCVILYIKGHLCPSTTDSGTTGSLLQDFYWGMELYPNILGWDVKQFTNCRAGMMFWAVGILCFAHKNMELNGGELQLGMAVNVALQLVYIAKFFHWEMGYMCSYDIQCDRAGFYICWGCLVFLPAIYTSQSFYLVEHGPPLSALTALAIFLFGLTMIFVNYDSDNHRHVFRQTHGKCLIWGHEPEYIEASYKTGCGSTRTSLLLVDGYWRWSRHFHYVPEILASLAWGLPGLNSGYVGSYFYVLYLIVLLVDRACRDDFRCRKKYGPYWDEYCEIVPYRVVPGVW